MRTCKVTTERNRLLFLTFLVDIVIACTLLFSPPPIARAFDPSQRSWINIEIPYYASDNILVKMSAVTVGNNLNGSVLVKEISSSGSNAEGNQSGSGLSLSSSVTVVVGRAVLQAEYSADTNTTTFTYTLSSAQYDIHSYGAFPYDGWNIGILFETSFNVTFDPRVKFCLTPSPNYYANYTTTTSSDLTTHSLQLEILHPTSFPNYVLWVFLTPIFLLVVLAIVCILIAISRRKTIDQFCDKFVAICSAVIVFIPVFQLSTQELKTPLAFTWFDMSFLALLGIYISLLCGLLLGRLSVSNDVRKLVMRVVCWFREYSRKGSRKKKQGSEQNGSQTEERNQ